VESHCPVLLVPTGTGRDDGTIDKAIYEWVEKVRCIDGQPPLEASIGTEPVVSGNLTPVTPVTDGKSVAN
jgi:hypothetical protein